MTQPTPPPTLDQILRRSDLWRGHSHSFTHAPTVDSGYPALNRVLQHHGWPLSCLVEVCQHDHASEWWLFHPAVKRLINSSDGGFLALINPPALPFWQGLNQLGIASERVLVIDSKRVEDFIACYQELSQSAACNVVLGWQPSKALSYTQLRKLQLSTSGHKGLYVIFRELRARSQSSPARLRLMVQPAKSSLQLHIFKQRGKLQIIDVELPAPAPWQKYAQHAGLTKQPAHDTVKTANLGAEQLQSLFADNIISFSSKLSSSGDKGAGSEK